LTNIHPQAIVDSTAELGDGTNVGPFAIIEGKVKIGAGASIGAHAIIACGSTIGDYCKISPGAVIGTAPQDLKFKDEETFVTIGNHTVVREYATINRATTHSYYTRVGDRCLIMAYAHIAHDCHIGNQVIIANAVNMAGHVIIGDYAGIGGMTAIHQFIHIGEHCFIGGGLRVSNDIPPYILAMGEPMKFGGLNKIGLKRRGFSDQELSLIKSAYKIIYRENLTVSEAIAKIENTLDIIPRIQKIIDFLKGSERGIVR
jgi:UDP-N-acetylglucosamine acyltransferase